MLWTLGRSLREGIEIHRCAPKVFSNCASSGKTTGNAVYRLQRYEIIIKTDGQIISRTYSGSNSVSSGNCFILENILFIGPQQYKPSNFNKRQFLANLRQLPRWDQTDFFCKRFSLHECKPGSRIQGERKKLPHRRNATKINDAENEYKNNSEAKIPNGAYQAFFSKRISAILSSFADFLKRRGESGRFFNFRCLKSYFPKSIAIFRESGIRILEKIIRTVALFFFIATSLFVYMIGFLKKHHKRWNDRKK